MDTPTLNEFLEKKPFFYKTIDYERMPRAFNELKSKIDLSLGKTIHIVGTNGKGSTGRFIANYLHKKGFLTAHYSSPHIFSFNERIWINGEDISNKLLEKYHIYLYKLLDENTSESLSYFEYTTMLFFIICHFCKIKFIILEAGLGGEFDATNVVDKYLSLITTIDYDHEDFLGNSIEKIATTKLNSINNKAILSKQKNKEVYDVAYDISNKKQVSIKKCEDLLSEFEQKKLFELVNKNNIPNFQLTNMQLALSAILQINKDFNIDNIDYDIFIKTSMPFRCQKIQSNIWVDVGHNQLAASSLLSHFSKQNKKFHLIYNSFSNKNYKQILTTLKPIIDKILYIKIKDNKMATKDNIYKCSLGLDIEIQTLESINDNVDYLVFGSFLVVEKFMKKFL